MLHDGRTTRVRARLLTAGTAANATASLLQRFLRGKIHDECRSTKSTRRTKPGSCNLASSAITDRTSASRLSVPSGLLDASAAGCGPSSPRPSTCALPPPPRVEDPTSSSVAPPKRRRSSLVSRHVGPGGIRCHFIARSSADLIEARAEASLRRRPVIVVAQDPPSSSCGEAEVSEAFSHPLVAEAIEDLFVAVVAADPVCVGDPPEGDGGGPSRRKSTAARIVWDQSSGVDGAERVEEVEGDVRIPSNGLSAGTIATAMVQSLKELGGCGVVVPPYLRLLAEEEGGCAAQRRTALFGTPCSQRAEVELARLEGVVATRAGRVDSRCVVSIVYDAGRVSHGELVRFALRRVSADAVFYRTADEKTGAQIELQRARCPAVRLVPFPKTAIRRDAASSKAALQSTCLCCVPLSELQSTRANRLVDAGRFHEAVRLLSPRQGRMLMKSVQSKLCRDKFRETIDVPIRIAWKRVVESGAMDED